MASNKAFLAIRDGPACEPGADNLFGLAIVGCRGDFGFTFYFEQSILSLVPSIILLLLIPIRLLKLYKFNIKTLPNPIQTAKFTTALAFVVLQFALLILWATDSSLKTTAAVPATAVAFVAAVASLVLSYVEHSRSVRPSLLLSLYLFLSLLLDLAQARTIYLLRQDTPIVSLFPASMGVKLALLFLEAQSKRDYLGIPYRTLSPESTGSIFNQSTFWWQNSLFARGFRKMLSLDDLYVIDGELALEPPVVVGLLGTS